MDTLDILGQILSEESPDEILDHYTEDSDPTQLVRRSSRIAARNPFSINEWPKERILATLYSLNIQVPPNLNHDQLLTFLQETTGFSQRCCQSKEPSPTWNRIQALESQHLASAPRVMFDGQTSSSTSNCALIPDLALPRRSLGSALLAVSFGVPFFPPAAAISPQLRVQILS
ncbi:hypothetical protein ABG768_028095, partial [Culter alburnus]